MPSQQTTLNFKILKTKKRLSDPVLNESALLTLVICCLSVFIMYATRVIAIGGSYGLIPIDIPAALVHLEDKGLHSFRESTSNVISPNTLVIGVSVKDMVFGDLAAFTTQRDDIRNKFVVPHIGGSPQVDTLLKQFAEWSDDRLRRRNVRHDKLVIVIPDPEVPVAVFAGVTEILRSSKKFSHVMVAGGLM
jgi:hypothetical protein